MTTDEGHPMLSSDDLTRQQLAWRPSTTREAWELIMPWKTEILAIDVGVDGATKVVALASGGDPPWDWRTVAFWASALGPPWVVRQLTPYRVHLEAQHPS